MSAEKWAVRKVGGYWSVVAPDDEAAAGFPWSGYPAKEAGSRRTFPFHYGEDPHGRATRALREHLDRRRT